jgi:hypothetical protein
VRSCSSVTETTSFLENPLGSSRANHAAQTNPNPEAKDPNPRPHHRHSRRTVGVAGAGMGRPVGMLWRRGPG